MKLTKFKHILYDFPVLISILGNGVWNKLFEKYGHKPGLMIKAAAQDADFINHVTKGIAYAAVKDITRLPLYAQSGKEEYWISFTEEKAKRSKIISAKETQIVSVPPQMRVSQYISLLKTSVEDSGSKFTLDSVIKRLTLFGHTVSYAYEIFTVRNISPFNSNIIEEELEL